MPAVSVVLPVYNAETTVGRALRSLVNQTLTDIEILVIDDGSTDGSVAEVQRCDDSRIRLIGTSHEGVASAANRGTQHARSDVIARMDADDVAAPDRLERQLRLLTETNADVAGSRVRILMANGRPTETLRRYERWINEETLTHQQIHALRFVEFPLVNPTITARRKYFELGFHDDGFPEDYDLMLRAAHCGMRFNKCPDVLLDWYDGEQRLTRTDARYSKDAFMSCRRFHLRQGPLAGISECDLWGVGQTGKPWLRWLQDQGISVRCAYDVNPRKFGKRIHGVPVFDGMSLPAADGTPLIIAVGADHTRPLILDHIQARGYTSGQDAWFVA